MEIIKKLIRKYKKKGGENGKSQKDSKRDFLGDYRDSSVSRMGEESDSGKAGFDYWVDTFSSVPSVVGKGIKEKEKIKELMEVLSEEKVEGETVSGFESRLLREVEKVME